MPCFPSPTRPHAHVGFADTQEEPYPCPYCSRSFQRSDVRSLHIRNVHGVEACAGDTSAPTTLKRKRVRTACEGCRRRKLRCDGEEPCLQCRYADRACQYRSSGMFNPTDDAIIHTAAAPTNPVGLERLESGWQDAADAILSSSAGPYGHQAADCISPGLLADTGGEGPRDDDIFVGPTEIDPSLAEPVTLPPSVLVSFHRLATCDPPAVAYLASSPGSFGCLNSTWQSMMPSFRFPSSMRTSHRLPTMRTRNPC